MEQSFQSLCSCLLEMAKLEQTLASNKLSYPEVGAMMELVDTKRKGFLDLNDIFELAGKVTEGELFDIFKFLDARKSGEVRIEDLQLALGDSQLVSNNKSKEHIFPRFYAIIDTVKDKPKSIAQLKKKYSLTQTTLRSLYQYICDLTQSKYLSIDDLLAVIKSQYIRNELKWSKGCESVVKELFPVRNVSQSKFIEAFASQTKNESLQYGEEENLLKGIEDMSSSSIKNQSIYNKLKLSGISMQSGANSKKPAKIERKIDNFIDRVQQDSTPSFRAEKYETQHRSISQKRESFPAKGNNYQHIESNINSVLESIQQRRQKLRQDSVQRKKIIDDVMQRKKQLFGLSNAIASHSQTPQWMQERQPIKNESSGIKKTNKSYLHHNPTFFQADTSVRPVNPYHIEELERSYQQVREYPRVDKYEEPLFSFERGTSQPRNIEENITASYQSRRPQTPKANPDISQILKKYTGLNCDGLKRGESQVTLKTLVKSKSGLFNEPPSLNNRESTAHRYKEQNYEPYGLTRGYLHNSSTGMIRDSYKQNVMKRAEEEAARKIEQIQRKARMKVLEKKGGSRHREDREWGRLAKQALHY